MLNRTWELSLLALLLSVGLASAQETMLDLIPTDAAAVAIRDLADLKKKGDAFIKESGINLLIRPSALFENGFRLMGVQAGTGVDEKRPAAILLVPPQVVGKAKIDIFSDLDKMIVVALPFTNLDKVAGNFGFKVGELKPTKLTPTRQKNDFGKFIYVRNKHLFLKDMRTLAKIADGKGLKLGKGGDPGEVIDVEKLVSDLGSSSYKTRELATLKLRLLGEPALAYLVKATKAADLEVSERAKKLLKEIAALAKLQKVINPARGNAANPQQGPAISSVGIAVEPDHFQLDLWLPMPELRVVAKQWGL